jgi:hypothetical protein
LRDILKLQAELAEIVAKEIAVWYEWNWPDV